MATRLRLQPRYRKGIRMRGEPDGDFAMTAAANCSDVAGDVALVRINSIDLRRLARIATELTRLLLRPAVHAVLRAWASARFGPAGLVVIAAEPQGHMGGGATFYGASPDLLGSQGLEVAVPTASSGPSISLRATAKWLATISAWTKWHLCHAPACYAPAALATLNALASRYLDPAVNTCVKHSMPPLRYGYSLPQVVGGV